LVVLPDSFLTNGTLDFPLRTGFGLKDMYDQDSDEGSIPVGGTGRFDIMSNALGWDRNMMIPGHMSPFSRLSTPGWLEPIKIERNGFYAIQPAEISGHIYKISHNFPEGEYLLIENRQPIKVRLVQRISKLCCFDRRERYFPTNTYSELFLFVLLGNLLTV
jgi:hypothetical protein